MRIWPVEVLQSVPAETLFVQNRTYIQVLHTINLIYAATWKEEQNETDGERDKVFHRAERWLKIVVHAEGEAAESPVKRCVGILSAPQETGDATAGRGCVGVVQEGRAPLSDADQQGAARSDGARDEILRASRNTLPDPFNVWTVHASGLVR